MKIKGLILQILLISSMLTGCGQRSNKWLVMGVDVKTEIGIRQDPIETFSQCLQNHPVLSADELGKQFYRETALMRRNRSGTDWGRMVCLAFNESATAFQAKTAARLLPTVDLSSNEEMVVGLLRGLLDQRALTLGRLTKLEKQLENSLTVLKSLKDQLK